MAAGGRLEDPASSASSRANPFGLVNWTVNAYALGAKQINPNATRDRDLHRRVERSGEGARRRRGARSSRASTSSASTSIRRRRRSSRRRSGIYGTGHHRDLREFAPKATLCSSVWVWDKFLDPELKKIAAGNWEPSPYGAFLAHQGRRHRHRLLRHRGAEGRGRQGDGGARRRSSAASTSMPARSTTATARSASPPARCSTTATCGRWTGTSRA